MTKKNAAAAKSQTQPASAQNTEEVITPPPSPAPEPLSTTKSFDVRLRTGDFSVETKLELDKTNPWGDLANIIATRGWLEVSPGRFLRYSAVQMVIIIGES